MSRAIFITGFPGFIAGQLLRRFLADPHTTVRMLVIPAMHAQAVAARDALPAGRDRTELVPGDITREHLGLDEATRRRLADEVDTVYHLAAIYDLATPLAISRLVNATGTEHVLDFCQSLPRLQRLVYFSTAYVSGTRTGRVTEDDLEQATSWKNYYEQTKWEAEVAVRRRWHRIPTTIIRPGVVVGDSRTGEINKYDGPYYVLRALAALAQSGWIRLARYFWSGRKDVRLYMVPVDFICDATEHLATSAGAAGKAYHVLPNPAVTLGELARLMFAEFGVKPPPFSQPAWLGRLSFRIVPGLARAFQFPPELFGYMGHDVHYDTAHLDSALAGTGIRCPAAEQYIPVMVDFVRRHPEIPANFGASATSRREIVTTTA
ncbi:MAG: SDR family oxidoreductase [Planctomycetia bacterium]|nr:SDR family oxidoreductase [Planctomycetia bacterium]